MITILIRSIHLHFVLCSPAIGNSKEWQHITSNLATLEQYKYIICKQNIPALVFKIWLAMSNIKMYGYWRHLQEFFK